MEKIVNKFINNMIIGDFHVADIENRTQYNLRPNGISAKGDYFSSCSDRETLIDDDLPYFPNVMFASIVVPSTDCFNRYIQKITNDIDIIIEVHRGSISGVNYSQGWEVRIGVRYAEIVFQYYHFKTSHLYITQYQIDYILNEELRAAIDFKNFVPVGADYKYWISDYKKVSIFDKKLSKVTDLYIKDKTLYYYDSMYHLLLDHDDRRDNGKSNIFMDKDIDKVVFKDVGNSEFAFPNSVKSIEFDLEEVVSASKYGRDTSLKGRIRSLVEANTEYYKILPEKYRALGEKLYKYQSEIKLCNENLLINFEYKNLTGTVITNTYQYNLFQEHYSNMDKIELEIAGIKLPLSKIEFFKSLKIKKKVAKRDRQSGYTDWFLKDFQKYPEQIK